MLKFPPLKGGYRPTGLNVFFREKFTCIHEWLLMRQNARFFSFSTNFDL
jgi:hypothetical protein